VPENPYDKYLTENANPYDKYLEEDRSALGEIGTGLKRGVIGELPKQIGKAMQWSSEPDGSQLSQTVYETGKGLAERAEERLARPENTLNPGQHNVVTNALASGAEMLAPSIAIPAAVGAGIALAPEIGLGAAAGLGVSALAGAVPMGMAQAQETKENVEKAGGTPEQANVAGWKSGAIETVGETVGTYLGGKLLGIGGKVLSNTAKDGIGKIISNATDTALWKPYAKQLAATALGETATEMGQSYGQATVEKNAGVDVDPTGQAISAIAPTLGMTALLAPFGLAGHYRNTRKAQSIDTILADPEAAPPEARLAVVNMLHDDAQKAKVPDADLWFNGAVEDINNGLPVRRDVTQGQQREQSFGGPISKALGTVSPQVAEPGTLSQVEGAINQEATQPEWDAQTQEALLQNQIRQKQRNNVPLTPEEEHYLYNPTPGVAEQQEPVSPFVDNGTITPTTDDVYAGKNEALKYNQVRNTQQQRRDFTGNTGQEGQKGPEMVAPVETEYNDYQPEHPPRSAETIMTGTGNPFGSERALRGYANRNNIDLTGFEIQPVDGGFIAVKRNAATPSAVEPSPVAPSQPGEARSISRPGTAPNNAAAVEATSGVETSPNAQEKEGSVKENGETLRQVKSPSGEPVGEALKQGAPNDTIQPPTPTLAPANNQQEGTGVPGAANGVIGQPGAVADQSRVTQGGNLPGEGVKNVPTPQSIAKAPASIPENAAGSVAAAVPGGVQLPDGDGTVEEVVASGGEITRIKTWPPTDLEIKRQAKELTESKTKEEGRAKLQKIIGATYEELDAREQQNPERGTDRLLDIADDYMADLETAVNNRDRVEVENLLSEAYKAGLGNDLQEATGDNQPAGKRRATKVRNKVEIVEKEGGFEIVEKKTGKNVFGSMVFKTWQGAQDSLPAANSTIKQPSKKKADDSGIKRSAPSPQQSASLSELTPSQKRQISRLRRLGKLEIVTADELSRILKGAGIMRSGDAKTQGATMPDGKVYLVSDVIPEGRMWSIVRHEIGLHVGQLLQTNKGFQELLKSIESRKDEQSPTGRAIRAAMERVPADTNPDYYLEELLAYTVENSPNIGIVRRFIAIIKSMLIEFGVNPSILTVEDLAAIADSAIAQEAGSGLNGISIKFSEAKETAQTKTNEFLSWFGKSAIRNGNTPAILYHGTNDPNFLQNKDYNWTFDPNRAARKDSSAFAGLGFFLGNESIAMAHSGGNDKAVHPFYVRVESPLVITSEDLEKKVTDLASAKAFRKRAMELDGHDGIIIKDRGQVIAFEPNQLKSASDNTGEFSRSNDDVRLSVQSATRGQFIGTYNRAMGLAEKYLNPEMKEKLATYLWDVDAAISRVQKEIGPQPETRDYNLLRRLTGKKVSDEIMLFDRDTLKPFLADTAKAKLKFDDLGDLGWAEHAPERNLQMRRVNAKRYIDDILRNFTPKEREQYDIRLGEIQDDFVMNDQTRNERRDKFISLLGGIANNIIATKSAQEQEIAKAQQEHDNKTFADTESKERSQKRIDNMRQRLENRLKTSEKWNDVKDRLSGMTDEQAKEAVNKWKKDSRYAKIRNLVDRMKKINESALDMNYAAGELTEEEYNAIKNTYKNHVPLYREDMDEGKAATGRVGVGPLASPIKIAAGSTKAVVDIFPHIIDRYQSAIQRKHKLEAGKVLYDMVVNNPDETRWGIGELEKKPYQDNEGNIRFYPDQVLTDNEVYVKVDGVKHIITVPKDNKPMMRWMEALKREPVELGPMVKASQKITRLLAALNTTASPEFLLTNFARDIQTAGIHLQTTEAKGMQKTVLKNIKAAIKGIFQEERGKESGEWGKIYRDFAKNGGKINWMQGYENVEELAKNLESDLAYDEGKKPVRAKYRKFAQFIGAMNTSVENGVRLATYKALIDSGVSPRQAARTSANLTVDFTRHGTVGPLMNSLFMFANAGIQGNVRMIKALAKNRSVQKIAAGIFGFGFAMNILGAFMGGDDDDGEAYYDKLKRTNPGLFERNMVFMLPDGNHFKIPMPYGYNTIFIAGNETASIVRGGKAVDGMGRVMSAVMNAFNPIGSATLAQTITPTILDPITYVAQNKQWNGQALMPKSNPFGLPKPESERYFKSVNPTARFATQWLNRLTGGTENRSGLIDVSPEVVEMLVETYTGSLGKLAKDSVSLPFLAASGDLEMHRVPFVRKVFGQKADYADTTIYRENRDEIKLFEKEFDTADNKQELRSDPKYKMISYTKETEKRLRSMRKRADIAKAREDKSRVEIIESRMKDIYSEYNKRYNTVIK
jgi:hypothetical protein